MSSTISAKGHIWEGDCDICESRSSQDLDLLDEVSHFLNNQDNLQTVLTHIVKLLKTRRCYLQCVITILNRKTGAIIIKVSSGLAVEMKVRGIYMMGEGITGQVVETGKAMIVPKISEEPRFLNKTGFLENKKNENLSFLCIPIPAGNDVLGTLSVNTAYATENLLLSEKRLLSIVASMISQSAQLMQSFDEEKGLLHEENERLHLLLERKFRPANIIGNSNAMQRVYQMVEKVAATNATCLILGESGTGKEVFAKTIHFSSLRAGKSFIKLNCAVLPESIVESELFGHEKGAFTGAHNIRKGRFELADGGTIFLDEIGATSPGVQLKLLRILQEKEFERVGGSLTLKTDVRVIAATNQDLAESIRAGEFREDLYYRLNVIPITIPPLRERKSDIILLAEHFIEKYSKENSVNIKRISTPAIDMLTSYHWPGNVRELENVMERAVILAEDDTIHGYHLPASLQIVQRNMVNNSSSLPQKLQLIEYECLIDALKETKGHILNVSGILGLSTRQLGLRLKKYGIDYRDYRNTKHH